MVFDVISFLNAYNIRHATHVKNWQKGWVQICCPFCGDTSWHGGFKLSDGRYNCWRCKRHKKSEVVSRLLRIPEKEAYKIMKQFLVVATLEDEQEKPKKNAAIKLDWPEFTQNELTGRAYFYLQNRGFDPEVIVNLWNIRSTSYLGSYKFRIVIPIFINQVMVSYTCRDITGCSKIRYKACPEELEVVSRKNLVYGIDYVKNGRTLILEGATDVWRVGPGAIATLGTTVTTGQINILKNAGVTKASVLFDKGAEVEQEKLVADLLAVGIEAENLYFSKSSKASDPGELEDNEVDLLRSEFL